ncbi:MAG TPA: DUF3817 domain-containing protein [Vineibacter sp.]|nr:DUF3817 domain-containing protein [Vineibacter sp.]
MPGDHADQRRAEYVQLRRMRLVSLVEGTTLVVLMGIAVPLKHLMGYPTATAVMGPIHGVAFLIYVWMVINTVSGGDWSRGEIVRLIVAAFVPFGAFLNARFLKRREDALAVPAGQVGGMRS